MARRTSIVIDEDKLARAQEALGTKGLRDTVELAFDEVIRARLLRELADQIRTGEGLDLSPEMYEQVRAPRLP